MIHYWLADDGNGYAISHTKTTIQNDAIPLTIEGAKGEGVLYVGHFAIFTLEGICAIPLSCITESPVTLLYIEGTHRWQLGTLSECDGQVLPDPPSAMQIMALLCRFKKQADAFRLEAKTKIQTLEEQHSGYTLFH